MNRKWPIFAVTLVFLLSGCVGMRFSKTGSANLTARPADCSFDVFTVIPQVKYEEVGIIEFTPDMWGGLAKNVDQAKELSKQKVCEAGGNGLILIVNGYGQYVKGTIVSFSKE